MRHQIIWLEKGHAQQAVLYVILHHLHCIPWSLSQDLTLNDRGSAISDAVYTILLFGCSFILSHVQASYHPTWPTLKGPGLKQAHCNQLSYVSVKAIKKFKAPKLLILSHLHTLKEKQSFALFPVCSQFVLICCKLTDSWFVQHQGAQCWEQSPAISIIPVSAIKPSTKWRYTKPILKSGAHYPCIVHSISTSNMRMQLISCIHSNIVEASMGCFLNIHIQQLFKSAQRQLCKILNRLSKGEMP